MTRAEKVARARELRAQGLVTWEIGERMGVAQSTASGYLTDPDLSKQRARRRRYARPCVDCGAPTDGSGGRAQPRQRCLSCSAAHIHDERFWTRERVVAAIRDFAEEHGRPPSAVDWNVTMARFRALPIERDSRWPFVSTVLREFGTWNAAIAAAGFTPRPIGCGAHPGVDPALCAEIRDRYEAGESSTVLARVYDCSPGTIRYRTRKAGGRMRSPGVQRVAAIKS